MNWGLLSYILGMIFSLIPTVFGYEDIGMIVFIAFLLTAMIVNSKKLGEEIE